MDENLKRNVSHNIVLPKRRIHKLILAFPASTTVIEQTLREKTLAVGRIGRYISIFRIDEVIVYVDDKKYEEEANIIIDILKYMEVPPYLKKKIIPLKKTLKYAGLLPPLQAPHHQTNIDVQVGEIREAIVVKDGKRVLIDVGSRNYFELEQQGESKLRKGMRLTVKILSLTPPKAKIIDRNSIDAYWGFKVIKVHSLKNAITYSKADLIIATSRYGRYINEVMDDLKKDMMKSQRILILFGGPYKGLYEIARDEGWYLEEKVHYVINTVPYQGVKTVRTEEAIGITLSIINILLPI